jgi:hypothetical protein
MQGFFPKRNNVLDRREALEARSDSSPFEALEARAEVVEKSFPVIAPAAGKEKRAAKKSTSTKKTTSVKQYKTSVLCHVTTTRSFTATKTTTLKSTVTKTAAKKTVFVTKTALTTVTSRTVLAAKTEVITVPVTIEKTSTSTSSTTTIETKTETHFAPSATYHAQCAPQNMVNSAVGQKIGTISFNKAFILQSLYPADTTGYGCCGTSRPPWK